VGRGGPADSDAVLGGGAGAGGAVIDPGA
jgi:hypothetical protein